ncbi:MAG: AAA family ATPase [Deltaproteobacteria bacterium]|nr:AAA family ATPase [Deltaproteobacteria bacterium]
MKTIAFFNNKGGVGKTTLVYHLAWMFAEKKVPVLVADLDPQANLTSMCFQEDRLEELWPDEADHLTVFGAVSPIVKGTGDVALPHIEQAGENLWVIPGDLALSSFEDKLSDAWPRCQNGDESAFRSMTAFYRLIETACQKTGAEIALIDVGPNLGAINRSALLSTDYVCLPLAPDMFSIQGLKNLGPAIRSWRTTWTEMAAKAPSGLSIPKGRMEPVGYVVMQYGVRESRPVKAYQRWMDKIPQVYREKVLGEAKGRIPSVADDPYNLAQLRHYRSLMPMAMDARKPMFFLKPADGAIGTHMEAVRACYADFETLASQLTKEIGMSF